ncbi:helix-turn-helix domain-containing protein, partial [Candidatus Kaiserbacteria bacterium]|nr:helix-turn-helix domain-containing protein [Candidatus Kaiserbacteria bacterium]
MDDMHGASATTEFISSKDAAALFGVTNDHVSRLCRQGRIKGSLEGGVWLVDKASVIAFFAEKGISPRAVPVNDMRAKFVYVRPELQAPVLPVVAPMTAAPMLVVPPPSLLPVVSSPTPIRLPLREVAAVSVLAVFLVFAVSSNGRAIADRLFSQPTHLAAAGATSFFGEVIEDIRAFFSGSRDGVRIAAPVQILPANSLFRSPLASPSFSTIQSRPVTAPASRTASNTVVQNITNPVVERVVETQRVVTGGGGVSLAFLNQRLQELDNKLSSQMYSLSYASSRAPDNSTTQSNSTMISQTNAIHELHGTRLYNPTITGATIEGSANLTTLGVTNTASIGGNTTIGGNLTVTGSATFGSFTIGTVVSTSTTVTNLLATNATTTNLYASSLMLGAPLAVQYGGTGTTTIPTFGKLLLGNAAGGYDLVATSSLGITASTTATWGAITGTLSSQSDLQSALDAKLSLTSWYATTTDALDEGLVNLYFTNNRVASVIAGTTTDALAEGSSRLYYTDTRVNTFLASSTTIPKTFAANAWSQPQTFSGGFVSQASSTVSGLLIASNASTTNLSTASLWILGQAAGCAQFDANGRLTTTGISCGTGSGTWPFTPDTYAGVPVQSTTTSLWLKNVSLVASSTSFTRASTTQFTASGDTWFSGLTSALLSTDQNGLVSATTTIGTNLLAGSLGTINGVTFDRGSTIVVASTTLLGDNNTFSGSNIFSSPLTLSGTSGTSTIASGQGFTIGSTQFVVQQGSGRVGIGTNAPAYQLDVSGTGRFSSTLSLGSVTTCTGAQALQTDGSGNISCGTISVGGASSGGGWTTNAIGRVSLSTTTDLVVVGASTSPYAKLSVLSGGTGTTTLALVPAAAQTANIFDIYDTSGLLSTVFTAGGSFGLGTTSPATTLSVGGSGYFTGGLGVGILNTSAGTLQTSGTAVIGGLLRANAGASTTVLSLSTGSATTTLTAAATSTFALGIQTTALNLTGAATSTAANGFNLAAGCFAVGGTCLVTGTTLLGSNNTWTGLNTFANSSTSLASFSGSTWFTSISANAVLATDANGRLVATTSLGLINGTSIVPGTTMTITAASSTLLANSNTFSGA